MINTESIFSRVPVCEKSCNYHVWTQEEIAKAYDVERTIVSYRINLHTLPEGVKNFVTQNLITERQLVDILPLSLELHFSPWLTTDQIRMKCAEGINQHKGNKTDEERLMVKITINLPRITNLRKDQNQNRST
jgi:hypothetical protein